MKNKLKQTLALSLVFSMLSHTLVFASPQKAAIESAYQKLSVMLASPELTEEDLKTELKTFQDVLLDAQLSKEEFEDLARELEWGSPTFDFEDMWASLSSENLLTETGNLNIENFQKISQMLQGQTGNEFGQSVRGGFMTEGFYTVLVVTAYFVLAMGAAAGLYHLGLILF